MNVLPFLPRHGGAMPAPVLDAALLECCAAAVMADRAAERALDGIGGIPTEDPAYAIALGAAMPFLDAYADALAQAAALPAHTPQGMRCKAALLLHALEAGIEPDTLAESLAHDVAGRA